MKRTLINLLILFMPLALVAQLPGDLISNDGHLITVRFDQKKELESRAMAEYFGINYDSLFQYHHIGKMADEGWAIVKVKKNSVVIARSLDMSGKFDWLYVAVPSLGPMNGPAPGYPSGVTFGFNEFSERVSVYPDADGYTIFRLYGNNDAESVLLSGNFNDWSTGSTPMAKVDDGWLIRIPLREGQHYYKFIVDGRWMNDPMNKHKEGDGYGGNNSVYFRTNHVFRLAGFLDARKVILTGSFIGWDEKMISMARTDSGWEMPVYLKDGTYSYKFIADKEWMTDPANPVTRDDGGGNINSVLSLGEPTLFSLKGHTDAKTVVLSGSFNGWQKNELPMNRTSTGWELSYVLPPGNYEYKFITDGNWIPDPDNNLNVANDSDGNSILVVEPNHRFFLKGYENAGQVLLSGSFNGWQDPGYPMHKVKDGWSIDICLPPGKTLYRFIIDGNWIADPGNDQKEFNEYGDFNSIIWKDMKEVYTFDD